MNEKENFEKETSNNKNTSKIIKNTSVKIINNNAIIVEEDINDNEKRFSISNNLETEKEINDKIENNNKNKKDSRKDLEIDEWFMYDVNTIIDKPEIDKINSIIVQLILPKLNIKIEDVFINKNISLIENIRNCEICIKKVINLLNIYFHNKNINNIKNFEIFDLEFNNENQKFQISDFGFDKHINHTVDIKKD